MQVGDRLKAMRLQNGMTLVSLSKAAGVSKSMLSRIERNDSAPTTTTLQRIANALGVGLVSVFKDLDAGHPTLAPDRSTPHIPVRGQLFDPGARNNGNDSIGVSIVRNHQRKRLIMPWGANYEMLCPDMQHRIEFICINYPVSAGSKDLYSHDGEECGVVVEGRFRGVVGDQEVILEAGDSAYYASSIPHRWENGGDVEAKAIWAIAPPSF